MYEFYMPELLELAKEIGRLSENYKQSADTELTASVRENNKTSFLRDVETFASLDLQMCSLHAKRIADGLDRPLSEIAQMLDSLFERMNDECSLRKFVALSVKDAEYIFPKEPLFGDEVERKFPSTASEIDEAGKCLGLSLPTASVFHLMRVMEIGVAAAARCLGLPDPIKPAERNWGAILRTLKAEFDQRNKALPATWANPDRDFFEEVYVSLDAVRNPWRNATMHVERTYTGPEAEHIFIAVKAFMTKLASRCDESGRPPA
jgi:hypothetical protein